MTRVPIPKPVVMESTKAVLALATIAVPRPTEVTPTQPSQLRQPQAGMWIMNTIYTPTDITARTHQRLSDGGHSGFNRSASFDLVDIRPSSRTFTGVLPLCQY